MSKVIAALDLLRKGAVVADKEKWKTRQVSANVLGGAILAGVQTAGAFGYQLPVDENTATIIAGAILSLVNVVLTYATSKEVGILPAKKRTRKAKSPAPEKPAVKRASASAGRK